MIVMKMIVMAEKKYDIVNETCNRLTQLLCLVGVKLEYFKYFIKDTKENKYFTTPDIVDLLNELSEEKEYFERKKEYFLSKWSVAHAENIQLRQENRELKKENDGLKEENNQLKQKLEILDSNAKKRCSKND